MIMRRDDSDGFSVMNQKVPPPLLRRNRKFNWNDIFIYDLPSNDIQVILINFLPFVV